MHENLQYNVKWKISLRADPYGRHYITHIWITAERRETFSRLVADIDSIHSW
jgi:hypothetical protein